jgi:hypothetical protein
MLNISTKFVSVCLPEEISADGGSYQNRKCRWRREGLETERGFDILPPEASYPWQQLGKLRERQLYKGYP